MKDISKLTATELGMAFSEGHCDPVEALETFISRIKNYDDQSIFISITEERARQEAENSALRYKKKSPLSPLDGVPVAWKDLFDTAGTSTTCGSEIFRHRKISTSDAEVVRNCVAAGMVVLGKVNLTEFAFSGLGLNPHYGTPKNPYIKNKEYIPGGSSSGSAVAVAAGLAPVSVGTDTGGSVRIPAAFNGLVGYKSSEGHISKLGLHPLSITLDTVGPIGKCVNDCVLMERALRGEHVVAPRAAELYDLTLLVPSNIVFEEASGDVIRNFEFCLKRLEAAGVKIKHQRLEVFDAMNNSSSVHGTLATAEAFYSLGQYIDGQQRKRIDERVVDRIEIGRKQTAFNYISIREERSNLRQQLKSNFDGKVFLAMPTVAITAPLIRPLELDKSLFHSVNSTVLRNTMIGNYFDLPGLTLPNGLDIDGLPTGILFNAYSGEDEQLMCYGPSLERAIGN